LPEVVHPRLAAHLGTAEVALHRVRQRPKVGLGAVALTCPRPGVLEVVFVFGA
jgi:hypothetical protein